MKRTFAIVRSGKILFINVDTCRMVSAISRHQSTLIKCCLNSHLIGFIMCTRCNAVTTVGLFQLRTCWSCSFLVLNTLHFQLVAHANNVPIARFKSRKLKLLMLQSLPVARIGHGHGCVGKIAEHVITLEQEGCIADTYEYGPVRWAKSFHL